MVVGMLYWEVFGCRCLQKVIISRNKSKGRQLIRSQSSIKKVL